MPSLLGLICLRREIEWDARLIPAGVGSGRFAGSPRRSAGPTCIRSFPEVFQRLARQGIHEVAMRGSRQCGHGIFEAVFHQAYKGDPAVTWTIRSGRHSAGSPRNATRAWLSMAGSSSRNLGCRRLADQDLVRGVANAIMGQPPIANAAGGEDHRRLIREDLNSAEAPASRQNCMSQGDFCQESPCVHI